MKKLFSIGLLSLICLFLAANDVFASDAIMALSPDSGTFGKQFVVKLIIDGHGERFNASQATVTVASNLQIKELVLGDCNFSFIKTPTIQNPSFEGVILSQYNSKCTVYTVTLVPVAKGKASIALSHTSVRRYGDAVNILSSTDNGVYTLTGAMNGPLVLGEENDKSSEKGLYTLSINVFSTGDSIVRNATVILSPVSKKDQVTSQSDSKGIARFSNVKAGVYSVQVERNNSKVGETIINVSGQNHTLTFGIDLEAQKRNNPLFKNSASLLHSLGLSPFVITGILLFGIVLGAFLVIISILIKRKRP